MSQIQYIEAKISDFFKNYRSHQHNFQTSYSPKHTSIKCLLTFLYGTKNWSMKAKNATKITATEMKLIRTPTYENDCLLGYSAMLSH
jgi:hypothetical protein